MRHGWTAHGWWNGPDAEEPERRPPKATCGGPTRCLTCKKGVKWWAPDPEGLPVTTCNFCKGAIIWAETAPNRNARTAAKRAETSLVPFDAEATERGRWALTPREKPQRPLCGEMKPGMAAGYRASGKRTFQRHVKTCPNVAKWPKGTYITAARQRGHS